MADAADLIMRASVQGGAETVSTLDKIDASATRAERSAESLGAGTARMASDIQRANIALQQQQVAMAGGAASAKLMTRAGLSMSRQFSDIAVTAAMGMNPLMILIQQGPQIADVFAEGRAQGVGFTAMLRGVGGQAAGLLRVLGPIAAVTGAAVEAFALFESEVDKNTKGATTWGQTWQATLNVVGKMIMEGPIGDGLKWLGAAFGKTLDAIVDGVMWFVDKIVGHFGAAYQLIIKNWQRLPEVFGVIAQGAANITIQAVEGLINKVISGVNYVLKAAGKETLAFVDLPEIKVANAKLAADYSKLATSIEGNFRKGRESFFDKITKETDRLAAAQKKGGKAAQDHAGALNKTKDEADATAKAYEELTKRVLGFVEGLNKALRDRGLSELQKVQRDLREGLGDVREWEGGAISAIGEEARLAAEVTEKWAEAQAAVNVELIETPDRLSDAVQGIETATDRASDLANAFSDVTFAIGDMFQSLKRGDLGGFLLNMQGLASGLGGLLQQGTAGVLSIGSMAANAIGGRTGRAIGGGLGIAAGGVGLGTALGTGGALAGIGAALGPAVVAALGPIALAAGALYAAAKLFNIGGKPSNKGAGFDLTTGAISGNKRSEETEQAARAAGEAILGIQDALKAAGLQLNDSVRGLVIGTRDQTQIYLASGKELRSAVGDAGAAVDAALRELLSGATYVNEAQKKLVESALATGKGFDAVAEVLAKYESAQGIGKSLADEIQRLTNPQQYDEAVVRREIEEARKSYQQLATEGYLTAEQLADITDKLATLEGLRLAEVMARYAVAVDEAADAAAEAAARLAEAQSAYDAAQADLIDAYNREAAVHRQVIDHYRQIAQGLRAFRRDLELGGAANRDPTSQYIATRREFDRLNALPADNAERLANLEGVSRAFIEASRIASPTEVAFQRDQAAVRRAVEASETAAQAQVDQATQQLVQLTAIVGQLVDLNAGVISVTQAINTLAVATAALKAAGGTPTTPPANDNFNAAGYLAANKDIAKYAATHGLDPMAFARQHYLGTGQYEITAGLRTPGFAGGGHHMGGLRIVGEEGPEIEATGPARYYSARDTARMMGGDNAELLAEVRALRMEVAALRAPAERTAQNTTAMETRDARREWQGIKVRGDEPDDPVPMVAA